MKYYIVRHPPGVHKFPTIKGDLIHIINDQNRLIYSNSFGLISEHDIEYYPNMIVYWSPKNENTKPIRGRELKKFLVENFEDFL